MKVETLILDKIDHHREQVIECNHRIDSLNQGTRGRYIAAVEAQPHKDKIEAETQSHITSISTLIWVLQIMRGNKEV